MLLPSRLLFLSLFSHSLPVYVAFKSQPKYRFHRDDFLEAPDLLVTIIILCFLCYDDNLSLLQTVGSTRAEMVFILVTFIIPVSRKVSDK